MQQYRKYPILLLSQNRECIVDETKEVIWLGDSQKVIQSFPSDIKKDLGADLMRLQCGMEPNNWKPFSGLKRNAFELRAKDKTGIYRTIYVTFIKEKICILHCFQKKTNKTAQKDVDIANQRLKELLQTDSKKDKEK